MPEKKPSPNAVLMAVPVHEGRQRLPIPWGLFIALGLYALAVLGYVWATYWRTPEYQAAEHLTAGLGMLGGNEGANLAQPQMEEAYSHILEAARLMPREKRIHDTLQSARYRMEERKMKLSRELVLRSEAVAAIWQRIDTEEAPILVVGLRDRGWTPREVLSGPKDAVLWSIPGGVVIILFWSYLKVVAGKVRGKDKEGEVQGKERELEELARQRSWGSVNDDGSPRASKGDVLAIPGEGRKLKKRPTTRAPGAGGPQAPAAKASAPKAAAAKPVAAAKKQPAPEAPEPRPSGPPKGAASERKTTHEVFTGLPKRRPPKE